MRIAYVTVALFCLFSACRDECGAHGGRRGNEAAIRADLYEMRTAIDAFCHDEKRYPRSLEELVPSYLRKIPVDPSTKSTDWKTVMKEGGVVDVRSRGRGSTCDGMPYDKL
jgi:general secretion pathway protein G